MQKVVTVEERRLGQRSIEIDLLEKHLGKTFVAAPHEFTNRPRSNGCQLIAEKPVLNQRKQ